MTVLAEGTWEWLRVRVVECPACGDCGKAVLMVGGPEQDIWLPMELVERDAPARLDLPTGDEPLTEHLCRYVLAFGLPARDLTAAAIGDLLRHWDAVTTDAIGRALVPLTLTEVASLRRVAGADPQTMVATLALLAGRARDVN